MKDHIEIIQVENYWKNNRHLTSQNKCLCHYENEIKRLTEENKRLKLALSEKLHELLFTNH